MATPTQYRFADCRIDLATRQVFLSGTARPTRPRVFDLLVYMIENRDRIIPKDELAERFWGARDISGNAIDRAVMLARVAIGDRGTGGSSIRTVHRVGYRFVAALQIDTDGVTDPLPAGAPAPVPQNSASRPIRLALLPFANDTGDARLKWVELGLPSLVLNALSQEGRIGFVTLTSVLALLENGAPPEPVERRARRIEQALGASCTISAVVVRDETGFALQFRSHGAIEPVLEGALHGADLTELGLRLASAIEEHLLPSGGSPRRIGPGGRFASECFARAMQASKEQRFSSASRLFALYLQLEPDNLEARTTQIRALSELGDPNALVLARRLLDEARAQGDTRIEAMSLYALSMAHFLVDRDFEAADAAITQSLALAPSDSRDEWYSHAITHKAQIHYIRGEYDLALRTYALATEASERIGHQSRIAAIMNNVAAIEYFRGNLVRARELFLELGALARDTGLGSLRAGAFVNQAFANASLGLFQQALRAIESGIAEILAQGEPRRRSAVPLVYLAGILAELRLAGKTRQLVQDLEQVIWSDDAALTLACRNFAYGHVARAELDFMEAARRMGEAFGAIEESGHRPALEQFAPMLAHVQLRSGQFDALAKTRRFVATFAPFKNATGLHGELAHTAALEARMNGQTERAREHLKEAVARIRAGLFLGYSAIDSAWMALEAGDLPHAESVARPIEPWLQQHPAGLVLGALLQFHRGDVQGALDLHERHVQIAGGDEKTHFAPFGAAYRAAARGSDRATLPAVRALPSIYAIVDG